LNQSVTSLKGSSTCLPGSERSSGTIEWSSLCKTAGIVNAYQAIQAADALNESKLNNKPSTKK
jgi:hypothetical protein